jgi:hypothetical protein
VTCGHDIIELDEAVMAKAMAASVFGVAESAMQRRVRDN